MKFDNPPLDEAANPNISHQHPLWVFVKDWVGMLVLLLVLILIAGILANSLAYWLPYSWEQRLLGPVANAVIAQLDTREDAQLQALAESLATAMNMDDDVNISVVIADDQTINAFATFDGHIVVMQGLLDAVDSEQAVAMALAHELAHIHHRDPLRGVSRSVLIEGVKALIFGGNPALDGITQLSHLSYSRTQETAADEAGLAALIKHYGNGAGAADLYTTLADHDLGHRAAWLSSHPDTLARQRHIEDLILQSQGIRRDDESLRPNQWQHQ